MSHYYNEFAKFPAQWLRNLMDAGEIEKGTVDERSITDLTGDDVRGYTQAHFFAGIGGWSLALRLAGWPADRPVWTGSCPCQPFSAAGKRKTTKDARHLWPDFRHLIAECRPATVFGEQVASKDGREWLAGVRADLEALGYAVGAADLCAAGVASPHIRQRLFWVADASSCRHGLASPATIESREKGREHERGPRSQLLGELQGGPEGRGDSCGLAYVQCPERRAIGQARIDDGDGADARRAETTGGFGIRGKTSGLVDANGAGRGEQRGPEPVDAKQLGVERASGVDWSDAIAIPCGDGRFRRIERGSFPLAYGIPQQLGPYRPELQRMGIDAAFVKRARANRVGRLAGYGNAIVPQVAAEFIAAFLETEAAVPV